MNTHTFLKKTPLMSDPTVAAGDGKTEATTIDVGWLFLLRRMRRIDEVNMKSFPRTLAVVALLFAAHGTAHAQKSWNVSSGSWGTSGNWNPSGAPATTDNAFITNAGTATLNTTSGFFSTLSIGSTSQIQQTSGNGILRASSAAGGDHITNAGLISVSTGTLAINHQTSGTTMRINNSGGVIRASSGGLLNLISTATTSITGGQVEIQSAGGMFVYKTLTLTDVAFNNSGTSSLLTTANQIFTSFDVNGTSSFTNSGTLSIVNSGNLTSGARYTRFQVASTGTFTNASTGVINITRDQATTLNVSNHEAYFTLNATGFDNEGAINITSFANQVGVAYFSSSQDFSNAGAITINGPRSSIRMASNTFTQSGGSLSLVGGGTMSALAVNINGGTLLGTGTINAPVTVGGIVAPGNAGIGTLTVSNNVTWNAGNAWLFQLGTPAVSLAAATSASDADLLSLTGAFTQGTGSTFTFDFATGGSDGWYKLVDYTSTNFTPGTNTSFAATNVPAGKSANFVVDAGSTALYVQIVPEPSTLALAGLGIGLAGFLACRRSRRG